MIKQVLAQRDLEVRANTPRERTRMLADLLRKDFISYKALLRNLVEIVRLDEALVVNAVLVLTDNERAEAAKVTEIDYQDALVAVRCADHLRTAPVLVAALSEMMKEDW